MSPARDATAVTGLSYLSNHRNRRHAGLAGRPAHERQPTSVLYLDLDGTVRHSKDELGRFVNGPADVAVFPEAVAMMKRWEGRIAGISNQGGVALGHMTEEACRAAIMKTDDEAGGLFDEIVACMHAPDSGCLCRKPGIGLIVLVEQSLRERFPNETHPREMALFVGDRPEDSECAANAGIRFMHAKVWRAGAGVTGRTDDRRAH